MRENPAVVHRWPWIGATRRERFAFNAAGSLGAVLPIAVVAAATQFQTYDPAVDGSNVMPMRNWADVVMAYGAMASFVGCLSCPLLLGVMATLYLGFGYAAAFAVGFLSQQRRH